VTSYVYPSYDQGAAAADIDIVASIHDNAGGANNLVGSTDGQFKIVFTPGDEFPKYGGQIKMSIPPWYVGTTNVLNPVFSIQPKTVCSSSQIQIATTPEQSTSNGEHSIFFSSYTPGQITLTCSNYRNPIYE